MAQSAAYVTPHSVRLATGGELVGGRASGVVALSTDLLLSLGIRLLPAISSKPGSRSLLVQLVDLLPVLAALQVEEGSAVRPMEPVEAAQLVVDEVEVRDVGSDSDTDVSPSFGRLLSLEHSVVGSVGLEHGRVDGSSSCANELARGERARHSENEKETEG